MSELGRLSPAKPNDLSLLTGYIQTLHTRLSISLSGDESMCDAREPSYRIYARARHGGDVQIGSAWLKTAKRGPRIGTRFFSITIDDPTLDRPLNVAAFRDDTSGDWIVIWRRRSMQSDLAAAA
jgi:uncharacterized protein (DUF736 family)